MRLRPGSNSLFSFAVRSAGDRRSAVEANAFEEQSGRSVMQPQRIVAQELLPFWRRGKQLRIVERDRILLARPKEPHEENADALPEGRTNLGVKSGAEEDEAIDQSLAERLVSAGLVAMQRAIAVDQMNGTDAALQFVQKFRHAARQHVAFPMLSRAHYAAHISVSGIEDQ